MHVQSLQPKADATEKGRWVKSERVSRRRACAGDIDDVVACKLPLVGAAGPALSFLGTGLASAHRQRDWQSFSI